MKRINALHLASALTILSLCLAPLAHAQTPPPAPAAPVLQPVAPPPPAAAPRAPQASSQVTVTRSGGCVTVKVCPGPSGAAQATPAPIPAPPPAAPRADRPAPPQIVCVPVATTLPPKRKPLTDPANTRLAYSNTAEVLGHGQWEFAAKGLVGTFELAVGLGNRFQLTFKTSPITWFIPDMRFRDSLFAGELRAQIVRRRRFKLTADATYFHVAIFHGLKLGLSAKIGTDKLALHLGVGTVLVFPPKEMMVSDSGGAPAEQDGSNTGSYDCGDCSGGSSSGRARPLAILTANVGVEARFWRYGKFFLDAFIAHMGDEGSQMTFFALVPGVRFHGKGFAADLGLGVMGIGELKLPLPVINLSYRW